MQKNTETAVKTDKPSHILNGITFSNSLNWTGLMDLWNNSATFGKSVEFWLFILHWGFKADSHPSQNADRVIFYLELADMWDRPEVFAKGDLVHSVLGYKPEGELRRELSAKAFQALCEGFFKAPIVNWNFLAFKEEVFKKLLWFFRRRQAGVYNNTNIHPVGVNCEGYPVKMPQYYLDIALEFAKSFCRYAWSFNTAGCFYEPKACLETTDFPHLT